VASVDVRLVALLDERRRFRLACARGAIPGHPHARVRADAAGDVIARLDVLPTVRQRGGRAAISEIGPHIGNRCPAPLAAVGSVHNAWSRIAALLDADALRGYEAARDPIGFLKVTAERAHAAGETAVSDCLWSAFYGVRP
jgi:hypothetical protein